MVKFTADLFNYSSLLDGGSHEKHRPHQPVLINLWCPSCSSANWRRFGIHAADDGENGRAGRAASRRPHPVALGGRGIPAPLPSGQGREGLLPASGGAWLGRGVVHAADGSLTAGFARREMVAAQRQSPVCPDVGGIRQLFLSMIAARVKETRRCPVVALGR